MITLTEFIRQKLNRGSLGTYNLMLKTFISSITITGYTNSRCTDGTSGPWTVKIGLPTHIFGFATANRKRHFSKIFSTDDFVGEKSDASRVKDDEMVHTLFVEGDDPIVDVEKQIYELDASRLLGSLAVRRTVSDAGLYVEWVIKIGVEISTIRIPSLGGLDPMPGEMTDSIFLNQGKDRRRRFDI